MELEKRSKKFQNNLKTSKKQVKGKLNCVICGKKICAGECFNDEKGAECLKTKSESEQFAGSPVTPRDEVKPYNSFTNFSCFFIISVITLVRNYREK